MGDIENEIERGRNRRGSSFSPSRHFTDPDMTQSLAFRRESAMRYLSSQKKRGELSTFGRFILDLMDKDPEKALILFEAGGFPGPKGEILPEFLGTRSSR